MWNLILLCNSLLLRSSPNYLFNLFGVEKSKHPLVNTVINFGLQIGLLKRSRLGALPQVTVTSCSLNLDNFNVLRYVFSPNLNKQYVFREESMGLPSSGAGDVIITRSYDFCKLSHLQLWIDCSHHIWVACTLIEEDSTGCCS